MEKYKQVNGVSYGINTPLDIINILESCRSRKVRVVIDYGDITTGESWGQIFGIRGYIGTSTGQYKIPILVYNKRSWGGCQISCNRIIKISESKGGKILYQHPMHRQSIN